MGFFFYPEETNNVSFIHSFITWKRLGMFVVSCPM